MQAAQTTDPVGETKYSVAFTKADNAKNAANKKIFRC